MESLVAIALAYIYAVNKERSIPNYTLGSFIDAVKKNLIKLKSDIDLKDYQPKGVFDFVPCDIVVTNQEGESYKLSEFQNKDDLFATDCCLFVKYSIKSMDSDFLKWLSWLDQDLVSATLDSNALDILGIKREDLPIKTKEVTKSGEMTVYSLTEKDGRESAIRCLESYGFKDINIGRGMPCQRGDKAYQFYFTGRKEINSLECYNNAFFEAIANLKTILEMEEYKESILAKTDEDGKLSLDNLFLALTALLDKDNNAVSHDYQAVAKLTGDSEAFYNRMVKGDSDVTVFINILGDEIMNFFWQGKFGDGKYERVVEDINLLSSSMNKDKASLEEIEEHIDELNKKPIKKELTPNSSN